MIAIPFAINLSPFAMIVSRSRNPSCNQFAHAPPMIAIPPLDGSRSLHLPVSSSRAESTANALVNRRPNKRRQMRWSPLGAQRALQARVAALDRRLHDGKLQLTA